MRKVLLLLAWNLGVVASAGGREPPAGTGLNAAPLGRVVEVQQVPGVPVDEAAGTFFNFPAHTRLVLNRPGERWKASYAGDQPPAYIALYPVDALLGQFPQRGPNTMYREVVKRLNALRNLQPAEKLARPLPYFPVPNAFQAVSGAARVIRTPTFRGVRYLTIHSQEAGVRFPREAVEYTFQGLTTDGRTLISMHVPYPVAALPSRAALDTAKAWALAPYPGTLDSPEGRAFKKRNADYLADLQRTFDAQDKAPQMRALDAALESLRIR